MATSQWVSVYYKLKFSTDILSNYFYLFIYIFILPFIGPIYYKSTQRSVGTVLPIKKMWVGNVMYIV